MIVDRTTPRLSVILPSYNGGDYLRLAVRSVVAQSFQDWELILLDDGSTDGSIKAIEKLGDPRIRIVSDGLNRGLAARLNQGLELARAGMIARMDADDVCYPRRFELQLRFLDTHPEVDLVGAQIAAFWPGGFCRQSAGPESHEAICARPWSGIRVAHPTWMARADWYRHHRYFIPEYVRAEDQELLLRAMGDSTFAVLPEILLAYRQGKFDIRKTQRARRSLLLAQWRHFTTRGQVISACLALSAYLLKTAIDMVATVPSLEHLFFRRMGGVAADSLQQELRELGVI
jgi:glycosyltransferase involved in cell wall biosynthesis